MIDAVMISQVETRRLDFGHFFPFVHSSLLSSFPFSSRHTCLVGSMAGLQLARDVDS